MSMRRSAVVLLLLLLATGCATTRVVRLDTGQGKLLVYTPPSDSKPVEIEEEAFREAMARLVLALPLAIHSEQEGSPRVRLAAWRTTEDVTEHIPPSTYRHFCEQQDHSESQEQPAAFGGATPKGSAVPA